MYTHPYEFDSEPLDVTSDLPHGMCFSRSKRVSSNLRFNLLRGTFIHKVRRLLRTLQFVTCKELIDGYDTSECTRLLE